MANAALNTEFLDKAIKFAVDAHAGTERRGKGFPYVVHVLEAMSIAATISPDQEILAAAALHDVVEDTDISLETLREQFGDNVAAMVAAESDTFIPCQNEADTWRARKEIAIKRIAGATREQKIVAMGDKLSNMRAIARDYREQGDALWKLFHAPGGKADHKWHYQGLRDSLRLLEGTAAFEEFSNLVDEVFGN